MPRVTGWSEDEFDDRAQSLAALIRRVWRAIARLIAAQAEQQSQVTLAVAKPIMPQWQQAVDGQIIGFVRNMYLDAAGTVSDALNAPDELLIGDDLVEVYTNAARNRLVGIGDDVWKNVQAQIALGNQSGESIPEIAARIRNVAGVSEGRSLTIARTEVHAAHEAGSYEQAVFVDPNAEKTWLATEDTRTRPSHRAVDGQTVKIGEAFNVGGSKLRYPGDPLGAPEDCINCRCSVAYNFDMITTVVDEPEPAMVAAGGQVWKAHNHPRGSDGKFIEKGAVSDFLKKAKPNIIDVTKAVGNLDSQQWGKLTDAQKTHIKDSVDKLPKGTATHDGAKKTLDSLEKSTTATVFEASPKPKTKMGEIYDKLTDAKDGDVLATGTKYNSAGVAQKFQITADKSHVHPDYMPKGKLKLEFFKKNGEPGKATVGGPFTINQQLHPLPTKGKKPSKVEWDEPGAPQIDTPQSPAPAPTSVPDVVPQAPAGPTKIPAGLKGEPGGPAKITTGVVWAKHPAGTTVVESADGNDKIVWNGKKYEFQSLNDIGDWATQFEMSKKDFYEQHKGDTAWKIPGGEKTPPPPFVPDANLLDQAYGGDDDTPSQQLSPEAAEYDPTPDEVDWNVGQWERENANQTTSNAPLTLAQQKELVNQEWQNGEVVARSADDNYRVIYDKNTGEFSLMHKTGSGNWANWDNNSDPSKLMDDGHDWYAGHPDAVQTTPEPPQTPSTPPVSVTSAPDWTKTQDFSGFAKVGGQAGSNPGGKYKAPDGTEWYIKKPKSKNHAANEQAAAAFYNLAGVDAPQVMKGKGTPELDGTLQTGTKIVPGANPNLGYKLNDKDYVKQIQSGFAMDAWLANWDVAGMGYDNIVEGGDGKPYRIDVGGAMLYRAQGAKKGRAFGNTVTELHTLRNGMNPQSAAVFGSMTDEDIRKSAAKVEAISDAQIEQIVKDAGLDASVAETLKARRKDILAKYPPATTTTVPDDAATTKAKTQALYDKGLITQQEYVDLIGEPPPDDADEMYGGIADKGVLLNDLESGAILPVPQAIDLGIMLNESDYNDLSSMEKNQLETTLSTAANMDTPGGKESYAHWQSLHNTSDDYSDLPDLADLEGDDDDDEDPYEDIGLGGPGDYAAAQSMDVADAEPIMSDEPDTSGPATSPGGALHYLDTGEQTKMVSSDGTYVIEKLNGPPNPMGKYTLSTKQTDGTWIIAYIHDSDDIEYVTEQVASLWYPAKTSAAVHASPAPSGPMIDGSTLGLKALYSLIHDGKTQKKYTDGQVIATSPNGTQQFVWRDDLNGYALRNTETGGEEFTSNLLKTIQTIRKDAWHVPESNLPSHDGTLVESVLEVPEPNDPIIDTDTIGVTNSGAMSALDNGDAEIMSTIDGKYEVYKSADGKWTAFKENHPDGTVTVNLIDTLEEIDGLVGLQVWYPKHEIDQSVNAPDATAEVSSTPIDLTVVQEKIDLSEYTSGEIIGITDDGQHQLMYSAFLNGVSYQMKVGNTGDDDLDWDSLAAYSDDGSPVAEFMSDYPDVKLFAPQGKIPAKKVANVTKATSVPKPGAYSSAVVTPGEKKFYLEDAEWGSLVAVEAVHLLNGAGGLDVYEANNLTPTQTGSINTQLEKALKNNVPGAHAAWDKWADLEQQINGGTGYDASKIADNSYFINVENDMWAGEKSTGDVFAITPDGKYQLMIHSTDGPAENPNSFALWQNGPLGWELSKIYDNTGHGGPPGNLAADTDTMSKTWLKPDDDDATAPTTTATFDPPGTGTALASTIFDMLGWVPEGKTLLIGKDDNGDKFKMVAGKSPSGAKVINVDLWYPNQGKFHGWAQFHNENEYNDYIDDPIQWDPITALTDKSALNDFMGNPNSLTTPTSNTSFAPVLDSGSKLTTDHSTALWAAIQNLDEGTVVAVGTAKNGSDLRMIVKKHAEGHSLLSVEKKHPVSDKWGWWYSLTDESHLVGDLDEEEWFTEIDVPGVSPNVTPSSVTTPSSATVTPSAPTVTAPSGPPVLKTLPIPKIYSIKDHLKANGNLGYYSKPENIWSAVKAWQATPGNEQYSPMEIFQSLDKTLKTAKPNPFQEKMTKWAASKKGAQIVGQDGIFGLTPAAPTPASPTSSVPTAKSMSTISGDSANDLWSSMEAVPVGTVLANGQMNPYKYRMVSVIGNDGSSKVLQIQFQNGTKWSPYETFLTKEKLDQHLKTQANVLPSGKYNWKPTLSAKTKAQAKATIPDVESGNDISNIADGKQKAIFDAFKSMPYTYLSSPDHAVFDAMQDVAKINGLTLAQVINIVDEQGAKKVSKPNAGLFKQKLVTWLKTPDAAAHILNEPTVVTGLANPPKYHAQYDPDLNPGQIPSFEESSKLKYDYVPSSSAATKIWSDIVTKTSDFSAAEKKALTVWTGGAYTTINGHLINPNPSPLSSTHKSAMTGSQLGMRPSDRPMILVRGTGFSGLGNAKNHAQLEKMVGTTWRNNGFAASSVGSASHDDPGVHSPAFSSYPLWIEFEAPPGTPMAWVTPFSSVGTSEREMLIGANLHYKILSVEKKMVPGYGMKSIARVRIVPKPEGAAE